jgi:putative membrane protein
MPSGLVERLRGAWPLPTALAFLAWFVFAPQCISTLAVTRRETASWRWPIFMFGYLFGWPMWRPALPEPASDVSCCRMMTDDEVSKGPETQLYLAEDQTLMSSERTYAGWLRTALTAVAVALGFTALFRTSDAGWVAKAIASCFLLLAVAVLIAADRRAAAVQKRLSHHFIDGASRRVLRLITWGSVLTILALAGVVWFLL